MVRFWRLFRRVILVQVCVTCMTPALDSQHLLSSPSVSSEDEPPPIPPIQWQPPDVYAPWPYAPVMARAPIPKLPVPPPNCGAGHHLEVGSQLIACVPDCPRGFVSLGGDPDSCVRKGGDRCVVLSPAYPNVTIDHRWGWTASLCDAAPVVRKRIDPVYPEKGIKDKQSGTVQYFVRLDERGKPFLFRDGSAQWDLEKAAEAAIIQWQWKPYLFKGKAIDSRTRVYFQFRITHEGPKVRTLLRKE